MTTPAAKQERTLRANDYKKLESSEPKTAFYVCGRKGTWFIEKFANERSARLKDQQDAWRVCHSCNRSYFTLVRKGAEFFDGAIWV